VTGNHVANGPEKYAAFCIANLQRIGWAAHDGILGMLELRSEPVVEVPEARYERRSNSVALGG
jgi:hypothetical protein